MKKAIKLLIACIGLVGVACVVGDPCSELRLHDEYWAARGADLDPVRRGALDLACRTQKDLSDPCGQLRLHDEYWAARGADLDPARRVALELACQAKQDLDDPCGQLMRHREAKGGSDPVREGVLIGLCFAGDITAQRMPQEFKLHGKLSKPLADVSAQIDQVPTQLNDAMVKLKDAYKQLVPPQKQVKDALAQLATAQEKLVKIQGEMKDDKRIPENIATPALRGMQTTLDTLPKVERVLQQMYDALHKRLPVLESGTKNIDELIDKQLLPLQNASDEIIKVLQQKNQFGNTLTQMIYIVSSDLASRNL